MLTLKEFAVPFGLLCIALWVWLLWARPMLLMSAFLVTIGAVILLYRNEDIVQLVFEPRRVLVEMKKIEENVYARVEELRKLAEKIGEVAAFNVAQLWRLAPEDPETVLVEERDKLAAMLRDMEINESRVTEIISIVDRQVTRDLARNVWDAVPRNIFSEGAAKSSDPAAVRQKITDTLVNAEIGKAEKSVRSYLER